MTSATDSLATKFQMRNTRPREPPLYHAGTDASSVAPTENSDYNITIVAPRKKSRFQKAVSKVVKSVKGPKKSQDPSSPLYKDVRI